jgi:single-stranded-DNA-specific exonuclease
VGLAAARLSEMYYRPAIVGQISEETTRCSCRSIHEFHITRALDQCADLLVRHGGHAAAAGFTVKNENVPALVTRLKSLAAEQLRGLDLRPTIPADAEVVLPELGSELYSQLELLQPTGYGNPEPLFVTRSVQVKVARSVGSEGQHLKLTVTDGRVSFDCIAFKLGHLLPGLPPRIDIIYAFEINEFNGRTNFQLNVKDIKAAGVPD